MIYVNDVFVTDEKTTAEAAAILKVYLTTANLVLINENDELLNEQEIDRILVSSHSPISFYAKSSTTLLRNFKEELHNYVKKVEEYIDTTRESEDFNTTMKSFVEVSEALLEFQAVANFLQKKLIDSQQIQMISQKALNQAEEGNTEYILDLVEYELLPILHNFIDETIEEM